MYRHESAGSAGGGHGRMPALFSRLRHFDAGPKGAAGRRARAGALLGAGASAAGARAAARPGRHRNRHGKGGLRLDRPAAFLRTAQKPAQRLSTARAGSAPEPQARPCPARRGAAARSLHCKRPRVFWPSRGGAGRAWRGLGGEGGSEYPPDLGRRAQAAHFPCRPVDVRAQGASAPGRGARRRECHGT